MTARHPVAVRFFPGCRGHIKAAALRKAARFVMQSEAVSPDAGLEVAISDAESVRELNRLYRGQDEATDVLSFATRDVNFAFVQAPDEKPSLGEVVICLPVAETQAKAAGRPVEGEIVHLLVHGLLHILAYDHENAENGAVMKAREDELLDALGFGGSYQHGH